MRRKKKKEKIILHEKYKYLNREELERQRISQMVEAQDKEIVIQKNSALVKLFEMLGSLLFRIVKILAVILFFAVLSLGVTVLVNSEIREFVVEVFMQTFAGGG